MKTKPGNTGTDGNTGGAFEFGAAPQADESARAAGGDTETEGRGTGTAADSADGTVETGGEGEQTNDVGNKTGTEGEDTAKRTEGTAEGKEGEAGETATGEAKPIEINGRTFASTEELAKAYENSSGEGLKLSRINKELMVRMNSLQDQIMELEGKDVDKPFPGLLTDEQLEALPVHKQVEYQTRKNDWEKATAAKKADFEKRKTERTKQGEITKAQIVENERVMAEDPEKYPQFKELSTLRKAVLDATPHLADRPDAPYISWAIAFGINAVSQHKAALHKKGQSSQEAKDKAAATQQNGKGVQSKTTNKAGSTQKPAESSVVKAYRERVGAGL